MINVLIIDDEPNIRSGLKVIVPWEEKGFKICGEGIDADDGLEKIIKLDPDIVLIDIKMRGKLGTDVIKESRKKGFKGKFIIISGYSSFEYAKEAIKYGVRSYLLKPIDEDELMEILLELDKEIKEEKKLEFSKNRLSEINLKDIILNRSGYGAENYKKYENFNIALISIENLTEDEYKLVDYEIRKFLVVYEGIEIFSLDYVGVLFKDFKRCRVINTLKLLLKTIGTKYKNNIFITVGKEVYCVEDFKEAFKSAKGIMKNKFLYFENGILYDEAIVKEKSIDLNKKEFISKLYSYVEVNNMYKLDEALREFENYILEKLFNEGEIKSFAIDIFFELKAKLIKDYDLDEKFILSNEEIIQEIYDKKSLRCTVEYLREKFESISSNITLGPSDNSVKRILAYMEKNYYKDLKLESLAEIFNYNSAYLGKLLKGSIGENFNTHLDKIRIENAKALLVNDKLKVYQVCKQVGYKNIDYFHSKFKKYVGTSPMNYKKQYENAQ